MLVIQIAALLAALVAVIAGVALIEEANSETAGGILLAVGMIYLCFGPILFAGFKIVGPNEAIVLLLFGKYYGTIKTAGFYFVNPFCVKTNPALEKSTPLSALKGAQNVNTPQTMTLAAMKKNISLKAMTLNNERQKVNDEDGNPIEIGVIVIWKIINTAKAVFEVDNYANYISTQADSAIRHVARQYPYDVSAEGDEKSLRGSSQEIAEVLKKELQARVDIAGIEICEARISHLAYAPEIAAAMLQRQQASAIVVARQKIVEGAVGMVEMALNKLNENGIVNLDEERKAAMVSNLLVVLCGNRDAQPIVNSGTIY